MDWIYLDNNATTPPAPEVVEAMRPFLAEQFANPSSVHALGGAVRCCIDDARGSLADLLGADPGEIVFTSGGTESDATAVRGLLAARAPRNRLVISSVEHSAVWDLAGELEAGGVEVVRVPVDAAGRLDLDRLAEAIDPDRTAAVSIMHANNETGVLFPVERIAALCRERGVPYHCDAVQSFGKVPLNAGELGAAAVSLSAHKFHGPKGAGVLYLRRGTRFVPWQVGHQERRRRGGTENVAGIVGLAEAARLAVEHMAADVPVVERLRDRLESGLLAAVPGAAVNGAGAPRLANTTSIGFVGCQSEALLVGLSERGLAASSGAACSSGSLEPSHVLAAMAVNAPAAHGTVRFSLSRATTADQVERAIQLVPPLVERLRALRA